MSTPSHIVTVSSDRTRFYFSAACEDLLGRGRYIAHAAGDFIWFLPVTGSAGNNLRKMPHSGGSLVARNTIMECGLLPGSKFKLCRSKAGHFGIKRYAPL